MTRGSLTLSAARIALAVVIPALVACGGDDDEPPDPSVLAEIEAALCEGFGPVGSMPIDGKVYDMSDCPPPAD